MECFSPFLLVFSNTLTHHMHTTHIEENKCVKEQKIAQLQHVFSIVQLIDDVKNIVYQVHVTAMRVS